MIGLKRESRPGGRSRKVDAMIGLNWQLSRQRRGGRLACQQQTILSGGLALVGEQHVNSGGELLIGRCAHRLDHLLRETGLLPGGGINVR